MKNTVLKLDITNADKYNFYLHEMTLSEGISQLSEALLTVYSKTAVSMADLKKLISTYATVTISQNNSANESIYRYFSGVISSVKHCGVAQKTESMTICKYLIVVQSPLAKLQFAFPHRYSTSKSVGTVIEDILNDHNISCPNPTGMPATKHPYFQGQSSDYEFLLRLLAEYDLNYMFKSLPSKGSAPEMHIFKTTPVLTSDLYINGKPITQPRTLQFHCNDETEGAYVMTGWEMSSSMGVDGIDINYENLLGQQSASSTDSAKTVRKKVFNTSPFGAVESNEVNRIAQSLLVKVESRKNIWQGTTGSLAAIPGMTLQVMDFGNADETVTALVTTAVLTAVAAWPDDFGTSPETTPHLEVQIRCCASDANSTLIASAESDTTAIVNGMIFHSGDTNKKVYLESNAPELIIATICSAAGAITPKNSKAPLIISESNDTYAFYALSKNSQVLLAHLTMPLGGYKQGLFRVPRIGEKVLLQGDGSGQFYLHSYLPDQTDMPFADKLSQNVENAAEMIALRHIEVTPEGGSVPSPAPTPHDETSEDILMATVSNKEQDIYAVNSPNTSSEVGIYPTDTSVKKPDGTSSDEAIADYHKAQTLVNVASQGNIRLSANNNTYIQAKNIKLSTPGWKKRQGNGYSASQGMIELSDCNALVVTADHSITFQVGNNSISITPSGIALRALKWSTATGPMDAAIYMDGISGIEMSGMNCSMIGALEVEVSDGMGAGISASGGTTDISGGSIEICTLEKGSLVSAFGIQVAKLIAQFASFGKNSEKLDNAIYGVSSALDGAIAIQKYAEDVINRDDPNDNDKGAVIRNFYSLIAGVFRLLANLVEMVWLCIDAWGDPEFLESYTNKNAADGAPKVTNRDAFRLTAMCLQLVAWGIVCIALMATQKSTKVSNISIDCDRIKQETTTGEIFSLEQKVAQAVVAGVDFIKTKLS